MSENKQVTFNLPGDLIEKMTWYVQQKIEPSKNAIVRKSVELYLEKLKQEALQKSMEEAIGDPMFMNDLTESMRDFEAIDQEGDSAW
jgi:alpha-amylase/alpha-mannosidase (GH57 family)